MPMTDTNNLVLTADEHINCKLALCHPDGCALDDGGDYQPSPFQLKIWAHWRYFWEVWVPKMTLREPYVWANLGDAVEGTGQAHKQTTVISTNREDMKEHALRILEPIGKLKRCKGVIMIRGTEAHGDKSGQDEEALAKSMAAHGVPIIKTDEGRFAHWEAYKAVGSARGKGGGVFHLSHHIGTTGSQHYESTALMKELSESYVEAARWDDKPLAGIVRAHRHRSLQIRIPAEVSTMPESREAIGLILPGWQGKTPFVHRTAGARVTQPQFGGGLIRCHKGVLYATCYVQRMPRPQAV